MPNPQVQTPNLIKKEPKIHTPAKRSKSIQKNKKITEQSKEWV